MSLLVPDYSSSSDDEEAQPQVRQSAPSIPVPSAAQPAPPVTSSSSSIASLELPPPSAVIKTTKRRRVTKKPKTALFLHPDIQRLLESGSSRALGGDSDSDDGDNTIMGGGESLLAKQKKAMAVKRPRVPPRSNEEAGSGLAFLPPPKHEIKEPKQKQQQRSQPDGEPITPATAASTGEGVTVDAAAAHHQQQQEASQEHYQTTYDAATTAQYQEYYQQQGYYDTSQYQYQYNQQQQPYPSYNQGEDETFGSSKRARNRERELERALQQGHFQSVASKIIEVQGPAPNAWAPPVDSLSSDKDSGEVKVQASFWNAQAGAKVATAKPNRMQRQKHQLNQLAFDAKLREHELLDKKGVSLKTKAETHAKYGW